LHIAYCLLPIAYCLLPTIAYYCLYSHCVSTVHQPGLLDHVAKMSDHVAMWPCGSCGHVRLMWLKMAPYVWCLFTNCLVSVSIFLISVSSDNKAVSSVVIVGVPNFPLIFCKSSVMNCLWNWLMDAFVSVTKFCKRPEFCGLLAHAHSSLLIAWIWSTSCVAAAHAAMALLRNLVEKITVWIYNTPQQVREVGAAVGHGGANDGCRGLGISNGWGGANTTSNKKSNIHQVFIIQYKYKQTLKC